MNTDLKRNSTMRMSLHLCLLLLFSTSSIYAQTKTITGRIVDEDLKAFPYMPILTVDTVKVGKTDANGFFQINIPASAKNIMFYDVGMDLASIKLADTCKEVEVVMLLSSTYDFITPRKVERLQLRRFKKLPALHKQAFEKGLFKTAAPCYTREYIPSFKTFKKNQR